MDHHQAVSFWQAHLHEFIRLLRLADTMISQQETADQRAVIYYSRHNLEGKIAIAIRNLGGLGAEW